MRLVFPLLIALMGIGAGIGAGITLRPDPVLADVAEHDCPAPEEELEAEAVTASLGSEYVKLNNQFVTPVLESGRVAGMVILSLSVEVASGETELVYGHEPKLRDAYNEVLFLHANAGGFSGDFTDIPKMNRLRLALLKASQKLLGTKVKAVLIDNIMRQDT